MAGTNHSADASWAGPQPVCVLVRPQMGENIGAAARAMWNFGLEHMRLVAPRDGWPNPKAEVMASGAARVLDQVQVTPDVTDAVADMGYIYATTARDRDLTKPILTPEEAMKDARARIASGTKTAILFGPERSGLENDDLVAANALISIPVNPAFASLNLAQSVLLLGYEWRQQIDAGISAPEIELAASIEVQKLFEKLEARLDTREFFWPEDKSASMRLTLRNLLSRMPLTSADIRTLHGVFRALDRPPR